MSLKLLSCNILEKEVRFLAAKNNWDFSSLFLSSSLHNSFADLRSALQTPSADILLYGEACHPQMQDLATQKKAQMPNCLNCLDLLLGYDFYFAELKNGAYFLLESSVKDWSTNMRRCFGLNKEVMREIFKLDRKYLLALRTPCSGDFRKEAEAIAAELQVELRWHEVGLEHLEAELKNLVSRNDKYK